MVFIVRVFQKIMYDIITMGSASIDVFVKTKEEIRKHKSHTDLCYHLGEKILVNDLSFHTGGGGTNTAVAFSRLGLKTGYIGAIGNDLQGVLVLKELKKENIDFLGGVKKGDTGYSIILPSDNDRAILSYKGINNSLETRDVHFAKSQWLYISTMLEKSFSTAQAIMKRHQGKIAANISMYLARQGIKKLTPFLKKLDVLILNREEAQALTGKKDINHIMDSLGRYVKIIVVTDGFHPIHAYDGKMHRKEIRRVKVIDSTGAGDAFGAGFVYGIIRVKNIDTCLSYGDREAKAVLSHIGAKEELLRHL
ncbi:carbohydrate kinase family protein [Candidatus Pacearchaeota archaeon]|nr:carbohydrate kinase family protein [Candidatus Pacearchaeota archaeon]